MESGSVGGNPTKKRMPKSKEDRISQLPDPILHVILSRLHADDVVKTCMFGRRWRNLWASMPYIRLYDGRLMAEEEDKLKFIRFVNTLLLSRDDSDVHKFCLVWYGNLDPSVLDSWICYLINHNVKSLKIDVGIYEEVVGLRDRHASLPDLIFTYQTLEELIFSCVEPSFVFAPEVTNLCLLRKLSLANCTMGDFLTSFINGCPVLEDLEFFLCTFETVDISSDRLKCLDLYDCHVFSSTHMSTMRICCPNLETLRIETLGKSGLGACHLEIMLENLSSLLNAYVSNRIEYVNICNAIDIIANLSNVEKLEFLSGGMEFIGEDDPLELPIFHNLKRLTLGRWKMSNNFQLVASFLKCSPNLTVLKLTEEQAARSKCVHYDTKEANQSELPVCCPHLQIVEYQIKGNEKMKVQKLMKPFLPNAKTTKIHNKVYRSKSCCDTML